MDGVRKIKILNEVEKTLIQEFDEGNNNGLCMMANITMQHMKITYEDLLWFETMLEDTRHEMFTNNEDFHDYYGFKTKSPNQYFWHTNDLESRTGWIARAKKIVGDIPENRIKVFWNRNASPIGFHMKKSDALLLAKNYSQVEYFPFLSKYYEQAEHYDVEYQKFTAKVLGVEDISEVVTFHAIDQEDEIWDTDRLPFQYERLDESDDIPMSIIKQDGFCEIGLF